MIRRPYHAHGGAFAGLALLVASAATADDALRDEVHRQYKHRSYMLVEDTDGARIFLFGEGDTSVQVHHRTDSSSRWTDAALARLQSPDARTRVRALTELAGEPAPEALDAALALLADPSPAVRDEAAQLIIDHPDGEMLAASLGLVDEDEEE
jgi:hypothetical protein